MVLVLYRFKPAFCMWKLGIALIILLKNASQQFSQYKSKLMRLAGIKTATTYLWWHCSQPTFAAITRLKTPSVVVNKCQVADWIQSHWSQRGSSEVYKFGMSFFLFSLLALNSRFIAHVVFCLVLVVKQFLCYYSSLEEFQFGSGLRYTRERRTDFLR